MHKRFSSVALACGLLAAGTAAAQVADPVVARRGTATITLSEVDAKVGQLPEDVRGNYMNSPERIEQTLQSMLLEEQMANEALERKLDQLPLFEQEIELAKQGILSRRRQQQFLRDLEIPDFEALARERYIAAPEKYTIPEQLELMHVLVREQDDRSAEQARSRAEEVRAKALSGVPFEDLVKEYTDERNRQTASRSDGKLRNVRRGQMVEPFEEAAFALEDDGDISEVVETEFGWHVIKLVERKPENRRSFESVQAQIEGELRKEFIERSRKYHVDSLRSLPLDADPDVVASLRTRYLGDGAAAGKSEQGAAADGEAATGN